MKRGIAVIDAETDPFRKGRFPQPFIWGYYNGGIYKTFRTTKALVEYISSCDELIYAHNGGKFDYHFLLDYMAPFDDLTIINGRIARFQIGIAELRDSYCIINQPLSSYKKDEIDYSIMEKNQRYTNANWKKINEYLKSDCVYLWEMINAFVNRFGPELTQASAAMKQWIKINGQKPEATNESFYDAISPYYYGGRVECFRSGIINTKFNVYDINSAYSFAMMQKHPYCANYEQVKGLVKNADFIRLRCRSEGALPFRGIGGDISGFGLSFPADDEMREYTVTKWEFNAALETDSIHKIKVIESLRFPQHVSFEEYINKFWKEREIAKSKNDILGSLFAKLLMNSLYGKFAANPDNYHNWMVVDSKYIPVMNNGDFADDPMIESKLSYWEFGGILGPWALAKRDLDEHEKRYYNVATGASITGFVRALLWRAIHSSSGMLYCDTDSIACKSPGKSIIVGNKLGQWKDEGKFIKAGIAGKKLYIFRGADDNLDKDGKRVFKKASKGARLTNAEIWRVANGGMVEYTPFAPTYSATKSPYFSKRTIVNTVKL